jgi:hypothetical protein
VRMVMNIWILSKRILLLSSWVTVSFTRLPLLYRVNLLILLKLTRACMSEDVGRRDIPDIARE